MNWLAGFAWIVCKLRGHKPPTLVPFQYAVYTWMCPRCGEPLKR